MTAVEYASARLAGLRGRVRLGPLLLSLLAFPFVAAGWVGGLSVVAFRAAVLATRTGYADVLGGRSNAD